ncbi:hypothetical protein [Arthrobacter sp. ISL-95]|uniref:hypothetical protein n=1 Tax=Arthrobacter sp. ISL-95 TaxID=2819116 RepID=UPI001BE8B8B7|nr:hypothetical protein [Arthrobacter sp. ISL-95]MBT2586504.1 hypothetical protein [Arthrobacter sp. ISL-95]
MTELAYLDAISIEALSGAYDAGLVTVDDWASLPGRQAEIRYGNLLVCAGVVDAVMPDGSILWIVPDAGTRRLFEKADAFEAWAQK